MATCSQGSTFNVTLLNFHLEFKKFRCTALFTPCKTKSGRLEALNGLKRSQIWQEPVHAAGFDKQAQRLTNSLVARCCLSSGTEKNSEAIKLEKNKSKGEQIIPVSLEVEPLLTAICDTTSISEFKLDLAGFRLYVKRDLVEKNVPPPVPNLLQTNTTNRTPDSNGSAATASLAISKPKPPTGGIQRTASDEGLVMLPSPKVGFFRTSCTIKGKRAPPLCKEKQEVKEGQVLCYIEQLGGEIPIESDVSGEIVKILREDGEPVGYGDALIAILPSFPGIKKLQ